MSIISEVSIDINLENKLLYSSVNQINNYTFADEIHEIDSVDSIQPNELVDFENDNMKEDEYFINKFSEMSIFIENNLLEEEEPIVDVTEIYATEPELEEEMDRMKEINTTEEINEESPSEKLPSLSNDEAKLLFRDTVNTDMEEINYSIIHNLDLDDIENYINNTEMPEEEVDKLQRFLNEEFNRELSKLDEYVLEYDEHATNVDDGNEIVEDEIVKDDVIEDEAVVDEVIEDAVDEEVVEDEAVEDDVVEDSVDEEVESIDDAFVDDVVDEVIEDAVDEAVESLDDAFVDDVEDEVIEDAVDEEVESINDAFVDEVEDEVIEDAVVEDTDDEEVESIDDIQNESTENNNEDQNTQEMENDVTSELTDDNIDEYDEIISVLSKKKMKEIIEFDWEQYVFNYEDLSGIQNKQDALEHWLLYGKAENRSSVPLQDPEYEVFDWEQYVLNYEDLSGIQNKQDAWEHWTNHGKAENRSYLSLQDPEYEVFDWEQYVLNYEDLSGIQNKEDAWEHWTNHGKAENRSYLSLQDPEYEVFDWEQYVLNYEDLSGIQNKEDAWEHWTNHGKIEGRLPIDIYSKELEEYTNGLDFLNINNIFFKQKYDRYGIHLFGWKNVINNFVSWFKDTKEKKYKHKIFFDEWIEKLLVWGNKKINVKYLNEITHNNYNLITFIHNPPFLLWNDPKEKEKISTEMIVTDNSQFNENIFNKLQFHDLTNHVTFLYTLSIDHKKYLLNAYPDYSNKIFSVHHPINIDASDDECFDLNAFLDNKKIYNIGWWLRNFKTFIDFLPPTDFKKIIIVKDDFIKPFNRIIANNNDLSSVEVVEQLDDEEYSNIFKKSCIFADIIDCIANNTVLECIKFNTPIILRRSKSAEEYLGPDYPLFFSNINELKALHEETFLIDLIIRAHQYLKKMNKSFLSLESFNRKIQYDLDKLIVTDNNFKLTWIYFVADNSNSNKNINRVLNNFLSQKNQEIIQLLFVIQKENLLLYEINEIVSKYSNIQVLELNEPLTTISLYNKITHTYNITTPYVTFISHKVKCSHNFSKNAIQYMDETHNCDIGVSSFIHKENKYIFQKNKFFFYDIAESNNLENTPIIWRKDIFSLLSEFIKKDTNMATLLSTCLKHNLNIRGVSTHPLLSIK